MTRNRKEKKRLRKLAAKSGLTYQAALQQSTEFSTHPTRQSLRLRTISLANFRGFRELDLELAPLTVLIGPNGSGKSTVLEALHMATLSFDAYARNARLGASIDVSEIFACEAGIRRDFRMNAELDGNYASRAVFAASDLGSGPRVNLKLSPAVSPTKVTTSFVPPKLSTIMIRHLGAAERPERDVLWDWLVNLSAESIDAVNRNLFDLADATLVAPLARYTTGKSKEMYFERGGVRHELNEANTSLLAQMLLWTGFETCLAAEGQNLVLLDEPEAHLHPTLQAEVASRLARRLREKSAHAVMATHSEEVCARLLSQSDTSVLAFPALLVSPRRVHTLGGRAERFVFEDQLGSGGYAEVFAATDQVLRRRVAIKLFRPGRTDISSAVDHAQALARIRHNNVVTIYEVTNLQHPVEHDARSAIVMEYLGGPNLAKVLSGPPLQRDRAAVLCTGIIAGLTALHNEGIVHHDLHDENIQLDAHGVPKILDVLYRGTLARLPEADQKWRIQQDVAIAAALLAQILAHSLQADVALQFRRLTARASNMDEIAGALDQAVCTGRTDEPSEVESINPIDLLSPSDQQALRDGRSLHQQWEDEEYQRWKDDRS